MSATLHEHEDFWLRTVRTIIQDTENGDKADLSLGLAIDMLWPCHWRFVKNLQIVLEAIGGRLNPDKPFAACGRNIALLPIRRRMEVVSNTLKAAANGSHYGFSQSPFELAILSTVSASQGRQGFETREQYLWSS